MCLGLMGDGAAETMAGKALIRGLHRAIRDMPEHELRSNLADIYERLGTALHTPQAVQFTGPVPLDVTAWEDDAGNNLSTVIAGD
jgi:hypothetical protein